MGLRVYSYCQIIEYMRKSDFWHALHNFMEDICYFYVHRLCCKQEVCILHRDDITEDFLPHSINQKEVCVNFSKNLPTPELLTLKTSCQKGTNSIVATLQICIYFLSLVVYIGTKYVFYDRRDYKEFAPVNILKYVFLHVIGVGNLFCLLHVMFPQMLYRQVRDLKLYIHVNLVYFMQNSG